MGKKPHFRLFGIPVRVEPVFFVIIAVFGLSFPPPFIVTWVAIAFVSVLVHELGHAVAFKAFGVQPSVVLYGMGGLTSGSGRLTPWRSIVVSLAGPLSTLVLFGIPAVWLANSGLLRSADADIVLEQVIFVNVGWAVLNLLPILPLDGGNVCVSLLDLVTGGRGRRPAAVVSIVLAGLVALWGFATGWFFVGLLGVMFAGMNVAQLSQAQRSGLDEDLAEAHRDLVAQQPHLAERHARDVLVRRPSPAQAAWARELLGWARLWQGDVAGAHGAVVAPAGAAVLPGAAAGPSQSFQAAVAMAGGARDHGLAVLTWSLANEAPGPSQLLGVMAAARLGLSDALVHELLLLGPEAGQRGGRLVVQLLDYAGFGAEAARAAHQVSAAVPRPGPPGPAGPSGWQAPGGAGPAGW
ncbi:MAG: hypothetical protein R2726_05970 [Acidimicrobiales bacterium]